MDESAHSHFSGEHEVITQLIHYIQTHLSAPLTIQMLSKKIDINEDKIKHLFKLHTGKTLHHFIMQCRNEKAIELLRFSSLPVKAIASD